MADAEFDLSTLQLRGGTYQINVRARAAGYESSVFSNTAIYTVPYPPQSDTPFFYMGGVSADSTLSSVTSSGEVIAISSAESVDFYEIEKLVRGKVLRPRFKLLELNQDETVRGEIPLDRVIVGGSYQENYQNGQRRNLSLTLDNSSGEYTPSINHYFFGSKFLFDVGLERFDGKIIWFHKGVFVLTGSNPTHEIESKNISWTLEDKFCILEGPQGTLPDGYNVAAGADVYDVIDSILSYNNGNGYVLDQIPFIYHSSLKGKKVGRTLSESAGQTWGSIILKLADMISAEVFYNVNGQLTFVPRIDVIADSDKATIFNLSMDEGDFSQNNIQYNYNDIVNRIIVVGANIDGHTCRAVAVNDNAESPICYQRLGYRTGQSINDTNITSDILAQERAEYELRKQAIAKTTINNTVCFNPLLSVNNIISITDEYYQEEREKILIQSISFGIGYDGTMSISSTNINNLPIIYK